MDSDCSNHWPLVWTRSRRPIRAVHKPIIDGVARVQQPFQLLAVVHGRIGFRIMPDQLVYMARGGQIIDGVLVTTVPLRRHRQKPAKVRQKDRDARWSKKSMAAASSTTRTI